MRYFLFIIFLLPLIVCAQTKIYVGKDKFPNDQIYEIKNNIVYRVNNPASKIEYLFIENGKVYFKDRKFFTEIKYSFTKGSIYKGNSMSTFDQLFELKDGKLYIGNSNFSSDCLFTLKDGIIYKGDSTSTFDAFMSYDLENPDDLILIAMLISPY
jgi:hypothetical protein